MLPIERPILPWNPKDQTDLGKITIVFETHEPPPGPEALVTKFERWMTDKFWRTGLFLRFRNVDEAIIEYTEGNNYQLSITVRGREPDRYLHNVMDPVEYIITEMYHISCVVYHPCSMVIKGVPCEGRFRREEVIRERRSGGRYIFCSGCGQQIDILELLTGYPVPSTTTEERTTNLDQIRILEAFDEAFDELESRFGNHREHIQELFKQAEKDRAEKSQLTINVMLSEALNGPRFFTLLRVDPDSPWDPQNIWREPLLLTLWCEHPKHEHPLKNFPFIIPSPRRWVTKLAPYALQSLKLLRIAGPLAAGFSGLGEQAFQDEWKAKFDFMEKLAKSVSVVETDVAEAFDRTEDRDMSIAPHSRTEGEALRAFHAMLSEANETGWETGDAILEYYTEEGSHIPILKRVAGVSDVLWVCTEHHKKYD